MDQIHKEPTSVKKISKRKQLKEMKPLRIDSKQYRTYNIISSPRTINTIGYNGTSYVQNLSYKQQPRCRQQLQIITT